MLITPFFVVLISIPCWTYPLALPSPGLDFFNNFYFRHESPAADERTSHADLNHHRVKRFEEMKNNTAKEELPPSENVGRKETPCLASLSSVLDVEDDDEKASFDYELTDCPFNQQVPEGNFTDLESVFPGSSNGSVEVPEFIQNLTRLGQGRGINTLLEKVQARRLNDSEASKEYEELDSLIHNATASTGILKNSTSQFRNITLYLKKIAIDLRKIFKYFRELSRTENSNQNFLETYGQLKNSAFYIDRSYESLRQIPMKLSHLSEKLLYQTRMATSLMKKHVVKKLDRPFTVEQFLKILRTFVGTETEMIRLLKQQIELYYYLSNEVQDIQGRFLKLEKVIASESEIQNRFKAVARVFKDVKELPLPQRNRTCGPIGRKLDPTNECNKYLIDAKSCDMFKYFKCVDAKESEGKTMAP